MQPSPLIDILRQLIDMDPLRSMRQIALACGIKPSTLSRMLSGVISDPRDHQLAPLAARYGLSVEQLRGRAEIDWEAVRCRLQGASQPPPQRDAQTIANMRLALIQHIASGSPEEIERLTRILRIPVDDALPGLSGVDKPTNNHR
ncbi:helix-turn-helix protein [Plasticicumulans lactativorans]|uniref:Helix-turn-helix protein n=1 Tax=Plasticicumulans lactativorans TaxID=1133106 RepID=A0A4R2LMB7_9GAMM|nr:helix-turn-helix transcriptional regulator [Plasticicumulans lactativorans]TCO80595.1 helix-turn-helix protein [Plasticicumulans lactativorans]